MKKRWIALMLIPVLLFGVYFMMYLLPSSLLFNKKADYDSIYYHFPKDYNGCAYIIYNVEGARELEINEKREVHHYFNAEGVALTSSPQHFGWASEESSGTYKPYYYVDGELLPMSNHIASSVGSGEFLEGGYVEFETFAFDDTVDCGGTIHEEVFEQYKDQLLTK